MAIEITPQKKPKISSLMTIFGIICGVLILAFLGGYFYLNMSIKRMSKEITDRNSALIPLEEGIRGKEEELRSTKQKIDDFGKLLVQHKMTENVFTFLERVCLPKVWFSSFSLDSNKRTVNVSAQADSLVTVEQQVRVLKEEIKKEEPLLTNVTLSELSIGEEGEILFSLLLTFNPQIFK